MQRPSTPAASATRLRLATALVVALALAACTSPDAPEPREPAPIGPRAGGTYRTQIEGFGFTDAFDPTGEYIGTAWGLYSQLLLRTLVNYPHRAGVAGNALEPDLASAMPEVSEDGRTYTFTIRTGARFAPPVDRQITSRDVAYAFQRINTASLAAQYGFYYVGVIKGMTGTAASPDEPIAGIETPDDRTIIFRLKRPTADFLYRLAMPATAPIPVEVARCFTEAGTYGRYLVASGPYMIAGSDAQDATSCDTLQPLSGFDPERFLRIVRNPDFDPVSENPAVRSSWIDGVEIEINPSVEDIFEKVEVGELDGTLFSAPPATTIQRYTTEPGLEGLLHADGNASTWFLSMNLTMEPFDDVAVRRAVSFVIDKAALRQAWGGPVQGEIATSIMPPTLLDMGDYDPYLTVANAGDLEVAREAMSASRYDTDGDGRCDAPECRGMLMIVRSESPFAQMTPILVENLAAIGIEPEVRELEVGAAWAAAMSVQKRVAIAAFPGWGKDYSDPVTYANIFTSDAISCRGMFNFSLVGMTPVQAATCGIELPEVGVPGVDELFDECAAALGDARTECWQRFTRTLMEDVVPWVPYLWGNTVTTVSPRVQGWEFDQFSGMISLAHIWLDPIRDPL